MENGGQKGAIKDAKWWTGTAVEGWKGVDGKRGMKRELNNRKYEKGLSRKRDK